MEEKYDNLQNEIKNIKTEEVDIQTLKIFSKKQTENKKERHYKTGANTRKCRENDLNARINGKKAEEAVKNHLRNNNNCRFELIEDKSSMICGYDLQCRDKETDNTIYMEVKCVNSGVFNLTKNEYETLFNPIYRQIYYFAFVEFDADKANISFVEGNKYKKEDFEIDSFICNNIVKNE